MRLTEDVRRVIETKLRSMGLELYEVRLVNAGRRSILRVFIDRPSGVTIDDCERASTEISLLLDVEDVFRTPYTLEVSSPGIDRPLREERDFRRAVGRDITVSLAEAVDQRDSITGTVLSCENGSVRLGVDGREIDVPLSNVTQAKMQIRFR